MDVSLGDVSPIFPLLPPDGYNRPGTFDLLCSVASYTANLSSGLEQLGLDPDKNSPNKVLVDTERGSALLTLEALKELETYQREKMRVVALTSSSCPEYWEDLWDLQPDILIVDPSYEYDLAATVATLAATLARAAKGEQYRHVPKSNSLLNPHERTLLRLLACGYSNKAIGDFLHLQENTVINMFTKIKSKIGVDSRIRAVLYYWGLGHVDEYRRPQP